MDKEGRKSREEFIKSKFVVCSCGYNNNIKNIKIYGTCLKCKKILDNKAYFKRQIFLKNGDKQRKFI